MTGSRFWNEAVETIGQRDLARLQGERLVRQLAYVAQNSRFYQRVWADARTDPARVVDPRDLPQLPLTTKEMLRQSQIAEPPLGEHLAADPGDVAIICASSGTTGRPVFMPLTRADQDEWAEILCRIYWAWGVRPEGRFGHLASFHMFTAGLPVYAATLRFGLTMLPIGAQVSTERALDLLRELRPDVLSFTPSFGEHLAHRAGELWGEPPSVLGVRFIGCGAEPLLAETRRRLEADWGVPIYDMGGIGEICTGLWSECEYHDGLHFFASDFAYVELIDPDDGSSRAIEEGVTGEFVYTALARFAAPLVRFRSGDQVTIVSTEPCACGRTGFRFRLSGRTDDMIKVHGVRVWASAIRDVIAASGPAVTGYAQVILPERGTLQTPPISVEAEYAADLDPARLTALKADLELRIHRRLLVRTDVRLVPEGTIDRTSLKYRYIRYEQPAAT